MTFEEAVSCIETYSQWLAENRSHQSIVWKVQQVLSDAGILYAEDLEDSLLRIEPLPLARLVAMNTPFWDDDPSYKQYCRERYGPPSDGEIL